MIGINKIGNWHVFKIIDVCEDIPQLVYVRRLERTMNDVGMPSKDRFPDLYLSSYQQSVKNVVRILTL